ncbi:XRE family transcriptional regulator [Paraburkholderia fungorum]|uniref:XRE family transcriptional regulator n=1 Tax=Paraburkholderia fungorum TaxID=134537 RepID=UPI0038BDB75E
MSLADRLREARTTAGMSQTELAERSGVSQSTIANIESGRNEGSKYIVKIADALNLNPRWLIASELPRTVYDVRSVSAEESRRDPNIVPESPTRRPWTSEPTILPSVLPDLWMDRSEVSTDAGGRAEWKKVEDRALSVKSAVFPAVGTHPSRCRVISVPDDSMDPFANLGDLFVIDLTKAVPREGRIFAILFAGDVVIRQVFTQPGGGLVLHAYNPSFPDKHIAALQVGELQILGQYVYRAGRARA